MPRSPSSVETCEYFYESSSDALMHLFSIFHILIIWETVYMFLVEHYKTSELYQNSNDPDAIANFLQDSGSFQFENQLFLRNRI